MTMVSRETSESGLSLIEVVLVLVIITIVARLVLRVVYAHALLAWEDGVWRCLGVDPTLGRLAAFVAFSSVLVVRVLARRTKRS
jgi:hypothetical protein